jgi:hypothetical protein
MSGMNMSDTLQNIKMLQDKEASMYSSLGLSSDGKPLDAEGQQKLLDEINSLTNLRVNLIKELKNQYNLLNVNVKETDNDIKDELASIYVMEQQLDDKKLQIEKLKSIETNKLRMANINNYYADRAEFVSNIYFIIVLLLIFITVILTLKRFFLFIPSFIFDSVLSLIIVIGIIYVGYKVYDLYSRDKMNFDQYDYSSSNQRVVSPSVYEYDVGQISNVRDILVNKEQNIEDSIISHIDTAKKTYKTDTTDATKELFTNMPTSYTPYDQYDINNYELNLLN